MNKIINFTKDIAKIFVITIKILVMQFKHSPLAIILGVVKTLLENGKTIFIVFFPALILDFITNGNSFNPVLLFITIYSLVMTVINMISFGLELRISADSYRGTNLLTLLIGQKGMRVDYSDWEDKGVIDKGFRATVGLWEFSDIDSIVFNELLGPLISFIVMSYIISQVHILVLISILALVILNMAISNIFTKKIYKIDFELTPYLNKMEYTKNKMQDLEVGKELRLYDGEDFICKKFRQESGMVIKLQKRKEKAMANEQTYSSIIIFLQSALTYIVSILKYIQGGMSISYFVLFLSAIKELTNATNQIFGALVKLKGITLYYDDFNEYMNREEHMRQGKKLIAHKNVPVSIKFNNVSFKYQANDTPTLKNINLEINAGEKLAIIGENGSGKSTFIKLLQRLYDPTSGVIYVNGVDIKDYDYDSYMEYFSSVFQDFEFHEFSIKENIGFDKTDDVFMWQLLNENEIGDIVNNTRDKLETVFTKTLDEDGIDFSGGERQKLAITRACFKNTDVLIWDEPTSALDPLSERRVFDRFNKYADRKTAIYISHRMSSTKLADRILVFNDGEIVENGTFSELMKLNGYYAENFNLQAAYYVND